MRQILTFLALTLLLGLLTSHDLLADNETEAAAEALPDTVTIKAEPLKVEVNLDGVFESSRTAEISVRPEVWTQLVVASVVAHGQQVNPGDNLIEFDTQKLDVAIEDLETELAVQELAGRQGAADLQALTKSVPEDLAAARRAADEAAENLERYMTIDRAASIKDMEQQVTSARNSLLYMKEEFDQLEKMYKADDLTEETEEIVLTRARHSLQAVKYRLKRTLAGQDAFLDISLPRREANLRQQQERTALALEKSEFKLPASLSAMKLAQEKLQIGLRKTRQKLERIQNDRKLMIVHAPVGGTIYYGQAARGKWPSATTTAKSLTVGSPAKSKQVLMTIVRNKNLFVRATLEEKQLQEVRPGGKVDVVPTAFPDVKLRGTVQTVSAIPIATGKFDCVINTLSNDRRIVAGMTCKANVQVYNQPNAILVPKTAVDVQDDSKTGIVDLVRKNDKSRKQRVRIGRTVDERLEILSGLKPDDKILRNHAD